MSNSYENRDHFMRLLEENEAILNGHFKLSSGLHSRMYVQCAKIQENPFALKEFTDALAEKIKANNQNLKVDCVVGPAIGGIIPAYQLAMSFGPDVKTIFAEKTPEGGFEFKRGFKIEKGKNYIVMEDVVTTGASFQKVSKLVKELGGNLLLSCSIIDRTNGLSKNFEDQFISLLEFQVETFEEKNLPDDLKNIPWIKPGSNNSSKQN
jgi:orotate phosphoribosyltransferase